MSVSAIAATSLAINNAQNAKEKRECEHFIVGYTHNDATVEESVQYAKCINTLHPTTTPSDIIMFKGAALIMLVCMTIGAVRGYRESKFYRFDNTVSGAFGGTVAGMSLLFIALIVLILFV